MRGETQRSLIIRNQERSWIVFLRRKQSPVFTSRPLFLVKPVGINMAQVCEMLVQRCIAPLSLHPSLKTAWPYQLVIGTANEWPSCDPSLLPCFTPSLPIKRRGFHLPWAYRTLQPYGCLRTLRSRTNRFIVTSLNLQVYTVSAFIWPFQQWILQHGYLASPPIVTSKISRIVGHSFTCCSPS